MNLLLEHLAKTWHIVLLYSLPATFINFSFCLIFFGHAYHTFWKKLVILVLIQGLFVATFIIYIPGYLQGFNTIISYFILFFIFFRQLGFVDKIRIPFLTFLITIIIESSVAIILLLHFSLDELRNPLIIIIFNWPVFIAFSILTYKLNKKKTNRGQRIFQFITSHKAVFYLSIVIIFQMIAVAALASSWNNKKSNLTILNFLSVFSIILSILIIYLAINFFSKLKSQVFRMTEEMYIEHINNLFVSIKSQRHDFLNNAQVMIALLHNKDKEGLEKYLDEYKNELQDINDIIVINEPAIGALIQSKKILADQHNVQFEFHFSGLEKTNLGIKIIDIVKILGNLIDNALDEVVQLSEEQRYVGIVCWTEAKALCFNVSNSLNTIISVEHINQMFQANYTSKQNGHSGLGLAIVKQKVEQLNGEITTIPEVDTITFQIRLPLKNSEIKSIVS